MKKLKLYLLASAVCALPLAANAADMPLKAAPYRAPAALPFVWTGFYVGGSAGFISQNTDGTDLGFGNGAGTDGLLFYEGDQYGLSGIGGVFGIDAGYNYQMGSWVIGVEADISASTVDKSYLLSDSMCNLCDIVSSKLDSLGTVRVRLGYAIDRALLYATGGLAYGHVKNYASYESDPDYTVSTSKTQTGWTVGGGLEYAVTDHWTARAEGLYVDLGSVSGIAYSGCRFGFKNRYTLGRVGVNYKF